MDDLVKKLEALLWLGSGNINSYTDPQRLQALAQQALEQGIEGWTLLKKVQPPDHFQTPTGFVLAQWAYALGMPRERFHEMWSVPERLNAAVEINTGEKQIMFHMELDRLYGELQPLQYYIDESQDYAMESPYIHELYYYARHHYPQMSEIELQSAMIELARAEEELDFVYFATLPWLPELKSDIQSMVAEYARSHHFDASSIQALISHDYLSMKNAWRSITRLNISDVLQIAHSMPQTFEQLFQTQPFFVPTFIEAVNKNGLSVQNIFEQEIQPNTIAFWEFQWKRLMVDLIKKPDHHLWKIINPPMSTNQVESLPTLTQKEIQKFNNVHRSIAVEQLHGQIVETAKNATSLDYTVKLGGGNENKYDTIGIFSHSPKYWELVSTLPKDIIRESLNANANLFLIAACQNERFLPPHEQWTPELADLLRETYLANIDSYKKTNIASTIVDTTTQFLYGIEIGVTRRSLFDALLLEKYCLYAQCDYQNIREQLKTMDAIDLLHVDSVRTLLQQPEAPEILNADDFVP